MTNEEEHNQVVTFGCRLNAYESETIKEALKKTDEKNLIVFNSCAVTSQAERQLRQAVRRAKKENPESKVVITGCAAQINPEKYAKMGEVDLVLGNSEKSNAESYTIEEGLVSSHKELNIPNEIQNHQDKLFFKTKENVFLSETEFSKIKVNDIMSLKDTAPQLVSYFENQTRAFLEIQNGCNHRCTFCIIPFGRGNSRSVSFGEIVEQTKKMVQKGHKEVVLTGVDITDYGKDFEIELNLSQMIKRLLKLVPQLPRLRLSSIDVAEIDDGIFDLLKNEPRFMPYLHLSVQSGDNMILKRMKRRHNRKQVIDFCKKAREIRPEITFGSDIIAGFPTETDKMFQNSLNLIKEAGLIFNHIFPYSVREGTPAANMPKVEGKIIKERAKLLREVGDQELQKYLKTQIGRTLKVIVEKNSFAKSENFLDVKVDNQLKSGEIVEVKIVGVEKNYLLT